MATLMEGSKDLDLGRRSHLWSRPRISRRRCYVLWTAMVLKCEIKASFLGVIVPDNETGE